MRSFKQSIKVFLQAHLKAAYANATPKLLQELAKRQLRKPMILNWVHHDNFKTLAITRTV
jgi:hypothetical protein